MDSDVQLFLHPLVVRLPPHHVSGISCLKAPFSNHLVNFMSREQTDVSASDFAISLRKCIFVWYMRRPRGWLDLALHAIRGFSGPIYVRHVLFLQNRRIWYSSPATQMASSNGRLRCWCSTVGTRRRDWGLRRRRLTLQTALDPPPPVRLSTELQPHAAFPSAPSSIH